VYRFGGEEFVLICDGLSAGPALALGERVRREIAASTEGSRVTVSVGVATCDAYDAMFQLADQRLYQAKAAGRNCVIGERLASGQRRCGSPSPAETPPARLHHNNVTVRDDSALLIVLYLIRR
jgi:hypothetical protein